MNTWRHALWMDERGHDVFIFCVAGSKLQKTAEDTGLKVITVKRNKKGLDLRSAIGLKQKLKTHKIQLVWFRDKRDLSVIALTKILSGRKFRVLYQQAMQLGVSKKEFWHTIRFKQIDYWIAPLHYLAKQVKEKTKFPHDKIHVIPLAIDTAGFNKNLPDKEKARNYFNIPESAFVIGMIGRIDPHKAQLFVLKTVKKLQEERGDVHFLMVGDKTKNEWEEYYKEVENKASQNERIHLFPFMDKPEPFYAATDVFVMASKNETFGMVTIEAMLSGKIIVGTNSAGTKELIGDEERGAFFEWEDSESLEKALNTVLDKLSVAESRAEKAKAYAEEMFDYRKEIDQIEKVIQKQSPCK